MPYHSIHPSTPDGYRRCTKCKEDKLETVEFFKPQKLGHKGLMAACRDCANAYQREHHAANPEIKREKRKRYDPEKKKAEAKRDRERNKESYRRRAARWYAENKEQSNESARQRYYADRERRIAQAVEWQRNNPDKVRVRSNRRQARKRSLPDNFTQVDWERAVAYWNGCCAYCDNPLYNLFGDVKAHADHFYALKDERCLGTIPENMLPACSTCNLSKRHSDPTEWLTSKLGKAKAKKKLAAIQAYFDYLRSLE